MKAAVYVKKGASAPLAYRDVEKPVPKDGEVLVQIHAVSVNAADYRIIRLGIGVPEGKIFGVDIAGRVVAAGENVRSFQPGDAVTGDISGCGSGGFAEYVAVPESALVPIPAGVSFGEAAAVPMSAVTALHALRDKGKIQKGQKVLVCGAGGGVGTFAVQLAKYYGAEVTAVCSGKNAEQAKALGADRVIDYRREDFSRSKERYDLITAVNGNRPLSAYKRALAPGGVCVVVGGAYSQIIRTALLGPLMSAGGRKILLLYSPPSREDLRFVMGLVESGEIKPVIDRRYPLRDVAEAVRYLAEGHCRGKVVIDVFKEED